MDKHHGYLRRSEYIHIVIPGNQATDNSCDSLRVMHLAYLQSLGNLLVQPAEIVLAVHIGHRYLSQLHQLAVENEVYLPLPVGQLGLTRPARRPG